MAEVWGLAAVAGAGIIGSVAGASISASGTEEAQQLANQQAAANAAAQSSQAFSNYLSSRGINIQQLASSNPNVMAQFQASGSGNFNDFIYNYLNANPQDPLWAEIANPSAGQSQNTTLPAYAEINGQAAQPALAGAATGVFSDQQASTQAATAAAWAAQRPDLQANWNSSPGYQQAYGTFQNYVLADYQGNATPAQQAQINAQVTAAANPLAPTAATLAPQVNSANQVVGNLLNGTTLAQQQAALEPAEQANATAASDLALQQQQQQTANTGINQAQLSGIAQLLATNTAGAQGIYGATTAGAQGINTATLQGLANLLGTQTAGAGAVEGATAGAAGGVQQAQIGAAQGISQADLQGIANLLGVSTQAAAQIFNASQAGAQGIYGSQLTQADTYAQSAQQALQQALAAQQADRMRQGFVGSSSGSNLERAQLMATALQSGAGARAQAGVNLQQALAQAGITQATSTGAAQQTSAQQQLQDAINLATATGAANTGYATNVGNAQITQAQAVAAAQAAEAQGQLQSGVNLATMLGGAGTQQAQTLAQANEQASAAQLAANTQLAQANSLLLPANVSIAEQQAAAQNAQASLALLQSGQAAQLGAIGAPAQLAQAGATANAAVNNTPYASIDALLNTLNAFSSAPASGAALTTSNPGSVINGSQIAGGALSSLGTGLTSTAQNLALTNAINGLKTPAPTTVTPASTNSNLGINGSIFAPTTSNGLLTTDANATNS